MAQRLITETEYLGWTDEFAAAIDVLLTAKGDEGTSGTAAEFCADVRDAIVALDQPDEAKIEIDFLDTVDKLIDKVELVSEVAGYFSAFNSAVTRHLGESINDFLNGAYRVHYFWRQGGNIGLDPENVFPPVTILGTYEVTGSGTGTLTKVNAGTTAAMYAGAALQVRVINQQLQASGITMTVNGTDFDGGAMSEDAVIDASAALDSVWAVGASTDWFKTITTVTITGGTSGDDLQIETIEDRALPTAD
jgi:hypothetical protein